MNGYGTHSSAMLQSLPQPQLQLQEQCEWPCSPIVTTKNRSPIVWTDLKARKMAMYSEPWIESLLWKWDTTLLLPQVILKLVTYSAMELKSSTIILDSDWDVHE